MMNDQSILIIDDEKDLCSILQRVFQKEHYTVDCAYSLRDAGSKLASSHPKVILLDNNLPDGSGLSYVHDHPSLFKESVVIVITADIGPATRLKAISAGITRYVQKPFTLGKIRQLLADAAR